jgi:hypothetical protein
MTCFPASTFPGGWSTSWIHSSISLFAVVFPLLFHTWRGLWLRLCCSTKDLAHVVLHGVAVSCVEDNLFSASFFPGVFSTTQLGSLSICLLAVVFQVLF